MLSLVQSTSHGISAVVSVSHHSHVLAENCLNFSCIISLLWSSSIFLWIVWAILGPENHINFNLRNTDRVLIQLPHFSWCGTEAWPGSGSQLPGPGFQIWICRPRFFSHLRLLWIIPVKWVFLNIKENPVYEYPLWQSADLLARRHKYVLLLRAASRTLNICRNGAFLSWGKQEEVLLLILCIEKQTLDFSWDLKKKSVFYSISVSEFFLSVGGTETRTSHLDFYLNYTDACIIASQ